MSKQQKLLVILVDGLGDVAIPDFQQQTPLQYARTPWLDKLAATGRSGLLDSVEPGLACGSDTAHMSILGYNPQRYYRGRGAFETMGAGLDMMPGDIAFKCNFAFMDPTSGIVVKRKADRHFETIGPVLCKALDNVKLPSFPNHTVAVKYAIEHRCGVRVRGPRLTDAITGTDPIKDGLPLVTCTPTDHTQEAELTSKLTNELHSVFSRILDSHTINQERIQQGKTPANCVLLRGCGSCIDIPSIYELHGLRSFLIAPTCIIAGIGMTAGMDILSVPGATGDYHTDFSAKANATVRTLQLPSYDFGFLHIKAVDETGHDRNPQLKVEYIEKVDKMVGDILQQLKDVEANNEMEFTVVVTSDHSTPVVRGDHSCEPVPFCINRVRQCMQADVSGCGLTSQGFNEIDCALGSLGRFCGNQVMPLAKAYLNGTLS
ncbi:archaeal type cofactor-independent phosphoglycerate mutase [Hesseltinella vesiculosa]|uniref:Archaeal type cofactor-independent phosphoglycerate mutase n=1 Tax=Hesseltinella vesiculosa TaxID=101127 RepID=A0A1X2GWH6_9FUNG|nr:archaeal type cofactor-independent phosphoglycerate mutase [Hesseltinella vesiculosa]